MVPLKQAAALAFRLLAVLGIAWLLHAHHARVSAQGDEPIRLSEAKAFLPNALKLRFDRGERGGHEVLDATGSRIGYVARTMPKCRAINGYSGPSDSLMVFGADDKLLGIALRHSYDTPSHVKDVVNDYTFMEQWNGFTWDKLGTLSDLPASGIYGVSGATRTSEAVAKSLALRAATASAPSRRLELRWQDLGLVIVAILGLVLIFRQRGALAKRRTWVHVLMVIYLGLISGDLIAQSLLVSWSTHGVPWSSVIGLVVLVAVAFLTPWSTGKKVYCTQICPHGHLQRWLAKWVPSRFKVRLKHDEKWSFRVLPGLLLIAVLIIAFLKLPLDLAGFEAFDAWAFRGAGIATLSVFGAGLIYSAFVPMGYCRHACPTGFLLDLVKREKPGFVKRDAWLVGLLLLSICLYAGYEPIREWILQ